MAGSQQLRKLEPPIYVQHIYTEAYGSEPRKKEQKMEPQCRPLLWRLSQLVYKLVFGVYRFERQFQKCVASYCKTVQHTDDIVHYILSSLEVKQTASNTETEATGKVLILQMHRKALLCGSLCERSISPVKPQIVIS